jgi:hypothetical protein
MPYKEIVLCLMFGCFGFFLSFFIARTVNIALILLLTWVPFKVIERYGLDPDWELFHKLKDLVLSLFGTLIELLSNLINLAPVGGMIFFLVGGIAGIFLNMKLKEKA